MLKFFGLSAMLAGMAFAQGSPFASSATVTGVPYSADVVNEIVPPGGTQAAPDGPVGHVYRDSAGRTRTERPQLGGPAKGGAMAAPMSIEITDPVAGVRYTLDEGTRVAYLQRIQASEKSGDDPRMAAIMAAAPKMTPQAPAATAAPAGLLGGKIAQPEVNNEKLGTRMIEGVSAEGSRRTTKLPDGLPGMEGPIVTVSETWYSPDLKVTVLTKDSDSRLGDRTTKLVNVSRSEPSASLFAPASDYKIVENGSGPQK
jgi:hypothetical protein